ncbi:hypothetical protein QE152_g35949 [Popillia japonica]|uniref:Uncharacterized protein n=1 Tax=Popillia japonica TaxID=7064 RepID=A0AAW1IEC7_POPJA
MDNKHFKCAKSRKIVLAALSTNNNTCGTDSVISSDGKDPLISNDDSIYDADYAPLNSSSSEDSEILKIVVQICHPHLTQKHLQKAF